MPDEQETPFYYTNVMLVRRRISDARRRLAGAELDADGQTDIQGTGTMGTALPVIAWDACDGDGLLALAYALDVLKMRQEEAA